MSTFLQRVMRGPYKYAPTWTHPQVSLREQYMFWWNQGWQETRWLCITAFAIPLLMFWAGQTDKTNEEALKQSKNPYYVRKWVKDPEWRRQHHFKVE
mmetsp:Transcript_17510/g.25142  ORF Transcript_17510/g.25142 Transcript_17510/m.25142 type:complete len:97 (-) Transcript_17510:1136-1426(-)